MQEIKLRQANEAKAEWEWNKPIPIKPINSIHFINQPNSLKLNTGNSIEISLIWRQLEWNGLLMAWGCKYNGPKVGCINFN